MARPYSLDLCERVVASVAGGQTGATLEILMKDVDLAIELGEDLGVPMWVCQATRLVLKRGVFQGREQEDLSRILEIIEDGAQKSSGITCRSLQ